MKTLTTLQIAELIDRFLADELEYPQEWNDFVETSQRSPLDVVRKKCYELDPLVNADEPDPEAVRELRELAERLRKSTSL